MAATTASTPVSSLPLPSSGSVVTLLESASLSQALATLAENGFLGAPVLNAENKLVGLVDCLDLTASLVHAIRSTDEGVTPTEANLRRALETSFTSVTVKDVLQPTKLVTIANTASLHDLLVLLTGAHRVVVLDGEKVINVVTQSAIVQYLSAPPNKHILGEIGKQTLQALALGSKPVVAVDVNDLVVSAFDVINSKGVSAVAVTDAGSLVGTVSARDIRFVCRSFKETRLLFGPVRQLLSSIHEDDTTERFPAITIAAESTLAITIQKMALLKVHRLWIATQHVGKLIPDRVVALGDIFKVLTASGTA